MTRASTGGRPELGYVTRERATFMIEVKGLSVEYYAGVPEAAAATGSGA